MLDDDHRVAEVGELVEHAEQLAHVVEVEARGRLVEHVDRAAGGAARQLGGELHALCLATGERRRRLAELQVAQADVVEGGEDALDRRHVLKQLAPLLDGERQDLGDVEPLVAHGERLAVVALAAADLAWHVEVGQEVHLDLDLPLAGAGLAATALDVEPEAAGLEAAHARLGRLRHQGADVAEDLGVGRRVAARRAADGALVDGDDLVEVAEPADPVVMTGHVTGAMERARQGLVQHVLDQAALARSRDAGDGGEEAEREAHREVLEVVVTHTLEDEPAVLLRLAPLRHRHLQLAAQILAGQRVRV